MTNQMGGRLQVPTTAKLVAQRIAARILAGELQPGEMLPPEEQLARELGISRISLREGIRVLETQGLVRVRPGRNGGVTVQAPDVGTVASSLSLLLRYNQVPLAAILEARLLMESICARLAAARRDPRACQELQAAAEHADLDPDRWSEQAADFHVALARASGNPVLGLFIDALREIIALSAQQGQLSESMRQETVQAHRRIAEAICAGNADAAERRIRRHMEAFGQALEAVHGRPLAEIPLASGSW